MKRELLSRSDGVFKRSGLNKREEFSRAAPEVSVRSDMEAHEEPTWEVHPAGRPRRRLDGRTRSILGAAIAAAVVVNAGVLWAYWKVTGSAASATKAGTVVELTLRGRSDLNRPLVRGGTGNMTVTLTNDNDFPIRITAVRPGVGNVIADDEHRDAGCINTGVHMTKQRFAVSWEVPRNTIGAFTLPDALRMVPDANRACQSATFTVPVQTSGVSGR